jgi:hypothetical protein
VPMRGLETIVLPFLPSGYAHVRIMMPAADAGRELLRTPSRRSSQNSPSRHSGEQGTRAALSVLVGETGVDAGQWTFCYRCDGKAPPSGALGCLLSSFERRKVHVPWVEREKGATYEPT